LPLAPFGIAITGIGGAAPYCGRGSPCAPQPPLVRPIGMDFRLVGADPLHPMVELKLGTFAMFNQSFLVAVDR
jgi:hypothetical protein